ncbi:Signal transduction histidine kinase [Draconibacterium orientale]|uniref:histidine kinase n=1 Tax=Draconibacterium orientale TaxID=1168034 RepID=X5DA63_9BACT|nr:HAMP domain-containing sensor histidine kinase [Draconibacterium orientale]AHW59678.1 histidine kinase [Draconibacterium orientale]SES79489.1 Signal transduction histidine kinase [Draconibacterium orientale]
MDIYLKRRRGKILLLIFAVLIGVASMLYTNWLTKKMASEERVKVEIWAEAIKGINNATLEVTSPEMTQLQTRYLHFLGMVSEKNTTIPILILNPDGSFNFDRNITYRKDRKEEVLQRELKKMQDYAAPISIDLGDSYKLMLYYRESTILRNLQLYPVIQLAVIMIFILVAYFAFVATNRAEQNQVWVGMSKETAHQLGTPISSLMAWIELLKLKNVDPNLIKELEQDTARLERITERFSKIGSKPELLRVNLIEVLNSAVSYLKRRSSDKVNFELIYDTKACIEIPLNTALFSWVIENLCKNAIDAMTNHGTITIRVKEKEKQVNIDLTDTGCGISKNHQKSIFHPGFSTKKRGWGLGLSLAKRIVEIYHEGKIFIKSSEMGKGTTFRIILNK